MANFWSYFGGCLSIGNVASNTSKNSSSIHTHAHKQADTHQQITALHITAHYGR